MTARAARSEKSARQIAADALRGFDRDRHGAVAALQKRLHATEEKQRSTDLLCGAVRNLETIDAVITEFSSRPTERISPNIPSIIRIAAYELIYRPQTPDYSILNEAVEYAKRVAGKKQFGFVNAVLRQIQRHIKNRCVELACADPRTVLPHSPTTGCQFDEQLLSDPQREPDDYLGVAFSLPLWLVRGWRNQFGFDAALQICHASNRTPGVYIRPNTLRTTAERLIEMMRQADVECETARTGDSIRLTSPHNVTALPGFAEGLFVVQDPTAAKVVSMLDPGADWLILDRCAAPGVKTTQLAQATGDKARIIATDISSERLEMLAENIRRLGLQSIEIAAYAALKDTHRGPYDAILLDVPCSNTGVLARRIEVRHRITEKAIRSLVQTQTELLTDSAEMLKPGGKLCYSTCSIESAETTALVADFLRTHGEFELLAEQMTLPDPGPFDHDGGYAAVLRRN